MPPKVDLHLLSAKRDNTALNFYELLEEFEVLIELEPELQTLEKIYDKIESKYRHFKDQVELLEEKFIDLKTDPEDALIIENKENSKKIRNEFLKYTQIFVQYKKKANQKPESVSNGTLTSALEKMIAALDSKQSGQNHGLEKLAVPNWDGDRKSYATWKNEFNACMKKYKQDEEEQLQRLRKSLPKNLFWTNQIKYCSSIKQAWEILDLEFENKRKLMDEILKDITSLKPIKTDGKSLGRFATKLISFSNNMSSAGCNVTESEEAPFVMSQLLSKLDVNDNIEFGREMARSKKAENIVNLIDWLNSEATLRSRGKSSSETRSENNTSDTTALSESFGEDKCPLGCLTKHHFAACPLYQAASVDEKWEIVRRNKRCRKCLRSHHTNNCNKPDGSTCNKCERRHHRSLHSDEFYARQSNGSTLNPEAPSFSRQNRGTNNHVQGEGICPGICPVQKVKIKDEQGHFIEVLAMIDSGSNTSFISKHVANKIGITGCKTHLTMNLAGGKQKSEESEIVNINIVSPLDESVEKNAYVYTVTTPCNPAKTVSKQTVESYKHLRTIANKLHLSGGRIDLLIGTDISEAFIDIHVKRGNSSQPIAKRNMFGWYLLGQIDSGIQSVEVGTISAVDDMKTLLTQDLLGIRPTTLCTCDDGTLKENKFVKTIADSTEIIDGRIQVRMPWKETGPPKNSNFKIAHQRMISSENTFRKRNCLDVIESEIENLVEQEFVVEIPPDKVNHEEPEWYLPMQAVFTPERTTKVRLVFDASAKGPEGKSLNDHLEKGPNYINSLPNVLAAWRWDRVAFCGDIQKMFNQVRIHPDDQIYHRFLWRTNVKEKPRIYQWVRLSFGNKPAPDIATGAVNTLAKLAQPEYADGAQELLKHAYVDDIGSSRCSEDQAQKVMSEIDAILETGKFQVKAWHSNEKKVDQTKEESASFLGHTWKKNKDVFSFKKEKIAAAITQLTKRECLKCLAQLWDPLGLALPVTIEMRIDLQELWSHGLSWDEIIPTDLQHKWMKNIDVLNQLLSFEFKRQLRPDNAVGLPEVHGFSDGGDRAYGAVLFLRWKLKDGNYTCVPMMVKAFVAPLKKKTTPRLELLGCLSLTRLYSSCKEALSFVEVNICKKVFWVDSTTVLSWITTPPKKFKPFVSVRVAEIQETLGSDVFRYIRTEKNPADALTKGIKLQQLQEWIDGPPFLKVPEDDWPCFDIPEEKLGGNPEITREIKKEVHAVNLDNESQSSRQTNEVLELLTTTCSTFAKTRRTLAWIFRFINNARSKTKKKGVLTTEELKRAETELYKWCQEDIDKVDKGLLAKEDDDKILRAHGRLENIRFLPADMKNPIILPRNHKLVKLLLGQLHETRGHCGYKSLIHEARRKYWIIGVRATAKQLTRNCTICKKLRQKPLEQIMGQLPSIRVSPGLPAFTNTALDMFGPIQIRVNRKTLKEAQVILFVCMTSRAVHLELCTDRSADTFIMAFRRFASLRGHPKLCWSDCGTNFKGAQAYFAEIMNGWDIDRVKRILGEKYSCTFEWNWNIPRASHMNGVVESLIKSVRQAIRATCLNRPFTEEQWRTSLTEITYLVNSRPLYPSSDDIWESPPITPNDLLIGNHISLPNPDEVNRVNPRDLAKSVQQRVTDFWLSWQKYFAPTLLPRNKWFRPRENLKIGDLVLEVEGTPRRKWKMALVSQIYPGIDGRVRKVQIKTAEGLYDRPIHKLCLIATKEELEN